MPGIPQVQIRKGFTLAELLVVCAILAILASVIVPVILSAREKSRLELCSRRIGDLGDACVKFQTDGVTANMEPYFGGLAAQKSILPWRTLRAIQWRENLPIEWADPLCVRKLAFFVRDGDDHTPIASVQGLGHIYRAYVSQPEEFYCPSSTVWTAQRGWENIEGDGSSYITYCSREGAQKSPEDRVLFNVYSTRTAGAFLSCASFMGYQGHANGWNVWFTDGHVRFAADQHGMLRDLKAPEWFDVPKDYPMIERRWSLWVHFDRLYGDAGGPASAE